MISPVGRTASSPMTYCFVTPYLNDIGGTAALQRVSPIRQTGHRVGEHELVADDLTKEGDGSVFHRIDPLGARGRSGICPTDPWHHCVNFCGKQTRPPTTGAGV